MKLRLMLIAAVFALGSTISASTHAGVIPVDKAAHAGLAFAGQVTCAAVANKITGEKLWSNMGCFLGVNALGAAKELTDKSRGGNPEWMDAVANASGSLSGGIVFQFGF